MKKREQIKEMLLTYFLDGEETRRIDGLLIHGMHGTIGRKLNDEDDNYYDHFLRGVGIDLTGNLIDFNED